MPKNILIVDDDEALRRIYSRIFGGTGNALTLAGGADEARALLASASYDLMITDYELGDGKGTELIETVRAAVDGGGKIIMISGSLETAELDRLAERYRLSGCFSKPFNLEALLNTVNEALA
ncbi:MAG: response regulator [Elusimicrobiales bacterium]|nr:response regulator [Elusimicrobiales bacterium]